MDTTAEPPAFVVIYDFVCPYSFIAQHEIDRITEEYELPAPTWRPHWLHPDIPVEGRPYPPEVDGEKRDALRMWLGEMSPEMGQGLRLPSQQHYSLHAFAAMEYATDHGAGTSFRRVVFHALWRRTATSDGSAPSGSWRSRWGWTATSWRGASTRATTSGGRCGRRKTRESSVSRRRRR